MVSLLFIANSPAIDGIKAALQPQLKARIDVVADFDHGLKDVFEKRPSTVCIQEQINGVTGESVARHIQMLLGTSAPSFILMHEANSRIKPIRGLFDHLVDLSQPSDKIIVDFLDTLRSLLGSQWASVHIPPPKNDTAAERAAAIVPPESKGFADQLVDDFLNDLDAFGQADDASDGTGQKTDKEQLSTDECVELLKQQSIAAKVVEADEISNSNDDSLFVISTADEAAFNEQDPLSPDDQKPVAIDLDGGKLELSSENTVPDVTPEIVVSVPPAPNLSPATLAVSASSPEVDPVPSFHSYQAAELVDSQTKKPIISGNNENTPALSQSANFTISHKTTEHEEIPEDLLLEFEKNFRSQSVSRTKTFAIALVVILACGAAGWYAVTSKPELLSFLNRKSTVDSQSVPPAQQVTSTVQPTQPVSVEAVPKQHSSKPVVPSAPHPATKTVEKRAVAKNDSTLPSFIPASGLDTSYSTKKPGWERYVGSREEYRLFRSDGRIKAVQVLSGKGKTIAGSRLASILQEVTGSGEYTTTSHEQKAGFKVSKGTVSGKAEILVYRKQGAIRAFVVSLN